jgi:hypothetical protein
VKLNNETITNLKKTIRQSFKKLTASDELGDVYTNTGIFKPDFQEELTNLQIVSNFKTQNNLT